MGFKNSTTCARSSLSLAYACDLSSKYDASLYLLHVVKESNIPAGLDEYIRIEHIETSRERVYLEKFADGIIKAGRQLAKDKRVEIVETEVAFGDPYEKILEFARTYEIDAIIMGSRGLGTVKTMLLGSVSNEVCHLAECTCMTVK